MTPVFIIGQARSGTNLTARILANHPEIGVALDPFMPIFRAIRDSVIRNHGSERLKTRVHPGAPFTDYYFDSHVIELLDLLFETDLAMKIPVGEINQLRTACQERASLESPEMGSKMKRLQGETYTELLVSMFDILSKSMPGKKFVGCKELWIEDFVPLLARAMPKCKFILTERDPRAIVASLLSVAANDPTQAAHTPSYMRHWRKGVALTRRYFANQKLKSRILHVCYEELVSDPELGARKMSDFLKTDFDPAMLEISRNGWSGNSGYKHREKNIYRGSLNRWIKCLAPETLATVEFLCGPEMNLTSYKLVANDGTDSLVIDYLLNANRENYSWRSDSGDAQSDFAWEALRHRIISGEEKYSQELLRRCFLFPETFQNILTLKKSENKQNQKL